MASTNFVVKNGLTVASGTVVAGGSSGTNGQVLASTGTGVQWVNAATGTGDVTGPASSTDNAVTRFDSTTGKLIQNSTVTLDDNGNFGNVNSVVLDNTPATLPTGAGTIYWEDGEGTPEVILKGGNTLVKVGTQEYARVYNDSGSTVTKGQVVYISGAQGNRIAVKLARADVEATSYGTLGFVAETITNGAEGWVIVSGALYKLNTLGLTAGATVYLSTTTAGAYTTTKPQAPDQLVVLGFIERVSSTVGSIYVKVDNGYELDELHDVRITSPISGNTLIYDATTSPTGVWKNASLTAGTGISVTNGAGSITIGNTGVTSVSGTSPVVSSGGATPAISLASGYGDTQNPYGSKTANYFLASPNGSAGVPTWRSIVAADIPTLNQNTTGNAATASALQTARNINGVSFNGTADITVTAAANTLTGTTLASGVTASSLTSVGTLTGLTVTRTTSGDTGTFTNTSTTNQSANVNAVSDNSTAISLRVFGSAAGSYGMLAANSTALYTTATSLNLCADNASGVIKFSTGSSVPERMRLDASGNLGIGVTPRAKLETSGSIFATSRSIPTGGAGPEIWWSGTVSGISSYDRTNSAYKPLLLEAEYSYFTTANGSEQMRINNTGVGIGTSNPLARLDIVGDATPNGNGLAFGHANTAGYKWIQSFASQALYINPLGNNVIFNRDGGSVGIGTVSPASRLMISGTGTGAWFTVNRTDSGTNIIDFTQSGSRLGYVGYVGSDLYLNQASAANTIFFTNSTERMRIDSSGNLGIGGTASSGTRLYVVGSNTTSNTSIPIYANQVYGNTGVSSAALRLNLNDGAGGCYLYGYSGGAGFMHNAEYLAGTGWTARSTFASIMETTSSGFSFYLNSSLTAGNTFTPSERMRIDSSGNVGIGRTPSYTLDLAGDARFKRNSGSGWVFQTPSSDMRIVGETSGAHLCFIPSSANVGIDTTSPSEKLNVIGKIKASDVLLGNNGTKGYGAITTTTSTSTPTGGSSGDFTLIY